RAPTPLMSPTGASWRIATLIAPTLAICVAASDAGAQQASASTAGPATRGTATTGTWTDPSHHRVRMITVAPKVSLEVLDWGGAGEPVVFLAGLGNSAHV